VLNKEIIPRTFVLSLNLQRVLTSRHCIVIGIVCIFESMPWSLFWKQKAILIITPTPRKSLNQIQTHHFKIVHFSQEMMTTARVAQQGSTVYHKFFMVKTQIFSVLPQKFLINKFSKVGGLNFFFLTLIPKMTKKSHIQAGPNWSQRIEIYMFNTSIEREFHSLS
jgi:hypothetical protein